MQSCDRSAIVSQENDRFGNPPHQNLTACRAIPATVFRLQLLEISPPPPPSPECCLTMNNIRAARLRDASTLTP